MSGKRTVWTLDVLRSRCMEEGDCWLWEQGLTQQGYPQACINGKNTRVQRFVYTELLGKRLYPGHVVTQACRSMLCCAPGCLRGISRADVMRRCYADGRRSVDIEVADRRARAVKQGWAKLDIAKAREIRARTGTHASIAKEFNVVRSTVSAIKSGKHWRETSANASVFTWSGAA